MTDRPVCSECEHYRIRKARNVCGWDAICIARSRNGRVIAWQYGLDLKWTKKELRDKVEIRICPGWCPEWEVRKK